MHHVPYCFSNNFLHSRINVDCFPFSNTATLSFYLSLCSFKGLLTTLWDTFNTFAMSFCFIPAFLMAILHILSSFLFVDLSNIHVLRLFHDSTAKEIHSCISTPGQYCVGSFRSWTKVNETNRTYPKWVAKIQVYMSKKTQNSFFPYFENRIV